ncbi:hypothetical protein C0991_006917, partial [Blastosporella zonata]
MQSQNITIEPSYGCPFRTEAIRIVPPRSYEDGLTLLFLHAVNLHKESLIPAISALLEETSPVRIKDIWAMGELPMEHIRTIHQLTSAAFPDNPNHGRSATLNRALLESNEYRETWSPMNEATAAYALLSTTVDGVDFSQCKIVLVLQSTGAKAGVLLIKTYPDITFKGVVFLDPAILPPGKLPSYKIPSHFKKMAMARDDTWANIDEARKRLLQKRGFRQFAPAAFELYLKYGLRPFDQSDAVTLACTKLQEFAFYSSQDAIGPATEALVELCEADKISAHLIVCLKDEFG